LNGSTGDRSQERSVGKRLSSAGALIPRKIRIVSDEKPGTFRLHFVRDQIQHRGDLAHRWTTFGHHAETAGWVVLIGHGPEPPSARQQL
jgi:hypothetical protein